MLHMDPDRNIAYQRIAVHLRLSPYLTGMETSWRPVGDSSLRGSRRRRGLDGSRGSRGEINHVRFFRRLFGDFFKSPEGLGDVAATSRRLFLSSTRRRLRDVSDTRWVLRRLRKLCGDVSATLRRRHGDYVVTCPRIA